MTHVVQFTSFDDFLADLPTGDAVVIYHDLHEQRIAASPQYGLSSWLLVTVIRAIVAHGRVTHLATLTIPHGRAVEHIHGKPFSPIDEANEPARWQHAAQQHDTIIDELRSQLGIRVTDLPGILNVPADLPFVLAAHPLDKLAGELREANQEATAPPG